MDKKRNFEEKMAKLSDEELYDVLAHEEDYVPEAIAAAKHELQSRDLSPERMVELETATEVSKKEEEEKANKPLPWVVRILMLIFAIGIPQAIVAESYRNRGYKRRAKECWVWMGYGIIFNGIIFYIIMAILSSV